MFVLSEEKSLNALSVTRPITGVCPGTAGRITSGWYPVVSFYWLLPFIGYLSSSFSVPCRRTWQLENNNNNNNTHRLVHQITGQTPKLSLLAYMLAETNN